MLLKLVRITFNSAHWPTDKSNLIVIDADGLLVARIAYLVSDLVLSVQPSLRSDSIFSKPLTILKSSNARNIITRASPEVRPDFRYFLLYMCS